MSDWRPMTIVAGAVLLLGALRYGNAVERQAERFGYWLVKGGNMAAPALFGLRWWRLFWRIIREKF